VVYHSGSRVMEDSGCMLFCAQPLVVVRWLYTTAGFKEMIVVHNSRLRGLHCIVMLHHTIAVELPRGRQHQVMVST
jgi:hypothetical protein